MAPRARSFGLPPGEAPPSVGSASPTPLMALSTAEMGQIPADTETRSGNQAPPAQSSDANLKPSPPNASSEYIDLLCVSELQARDPNYHGVRAFTDILAFTQAYLEHDLDRDWSSVRSAILLGEDATVERLMEEQIIGKVFSNLKLAKLRHFMTGLDKISSRDLKVFLKYVSPEGKSNVRYPWAARQWRVLRSPRLFEDWARSLIMNDKARISRFLGLLVKFTDINIGNKQKTEGYPGRLINFLATGASLVASIFFGAPLVVLASEAFPRWVNIVVIVVWVLIFLMFLIWWGVDSSHMFLYVLAYTTMLANINVGGD
ncbi:unnamed protein product [Clonostachys rosea]|uniref:Uncharacterized protein n=1 Tax=Bionectria ochroleuca TaxID=29856 RepID=A0ABY6UP72_BIOOC|nr:unnamed protein product [Clonostachys rosea]